MRSVVFLVAAATASAQSSMPSCMIQPTGLGVTYDLSPLMQQLQRIDDNRNETISTWYDYWFGVCSDLDDSFFSSHSQCWNTSGDDGSTYTVGYGSAFQVGKASNTLGFCKRIGGPASNGVMMPMGGGRWRGGLASGVTLFYQGGDNCLSPFNGTQYVPRSVAFDFQCYDSNGFVPKYDTIIEDIQCTYHAIIKSRYGCPTECKRGGPANRVCSANGICGYDMTNSYAKCFCNAGFSGADCTAVGDKGLPPPTDFSPNIAGGFFGGLVGGIICAAGFFIFKSKLSGGASGGSFFDSFSFGKIGGGGGATAPRSSAGYTAAPTSTWSGAASTTGYVAPSADLGGAAGMGDVYGQLGSGDGPLLS